MIGPTDDYLLVLAAARSGVSDMGAGVDAYPEFNLCCTFEDVVSETSDLLLGVD